MSTKKNKFSIYIYVVITIIGCVLACSSIVPNDYLKLVVVMGALGVGLYGIMKGLSTPSTTEDDVVIHYLGINRNKRLLQYVIKRDNNG